MPARIPSSEADPVYAAGGATDAELASAITTVNAALAAKQASATAATDAELASAVADLEALLADKADSADVATDIAAAVSAHAAGDASDAELAAAVASLTASIAAKQDASTASTDAERDAHMASGTLAARPAAATFGVGFYYATDDNGGTLYYSNGSAWVIVGPRGVELQHVENGTSYVTASLAASAVEDITGMSITFTPRDRPVVLEAGIPNWGIGTNGARPRLQIRKSDNSVVASRGYNSTATGTQPGPHLFARLDLTAGVAVTYKLSVKNAAGATSSVITAFATDQAESPMYLLAREV